MTLQVTPRRWAALVLVVLVLGGCSTLPASGPVHTRPDPSVNASLAAPYFEPPGPTRGDDQAGIVRGFLLAMQANPPSTAVAREFLSERSRTEWKPVQGTIVYDVSTVETAGGAVSARLTDAHRLDPSGGWIGGTAAATTTVPFSLVQEGGQWRIDNPPNALAVPSSYFSSLFAPFDLYFYDRSGTVLVPSRVYIPRGEQTATDLVRGLLAGPSASLAQVAVSAFAPQTGLDLSVVVNDAGVAEIPLGPRFSQLAPADLARAVAQLARTLRQVPGINRLRVTVAGTPVPLIGGATDVSVNAGSEADPDLAQARDLVAIQNKRVVRLGTGVPTPIGGPLGQPGFSLRSVALDIAAYRVAAVATNGTRLYTAADRGSTAVKDVSSMLVGASNLLRPTYDQFGGLWDIDATPGGAVVHLVGTRRDRVLSVPGISGQRVSAFTVTADGTRLVAALATGSTPTILVSSIVRSTSGAVLDVLPAGRIPYNGADLGAAIDVAQNSPTTVAVLSQATKDSGRIVSLELDGSPGDPSTATPALVPGVLVGLVASPDTSLPEQVITYDHRLLLRGDTGQWVRAADAVLAGAYP
jgi:hypothetical protein